MSVQKLIGILDLFLAKELTDDSFERIRAHMLVFLILVNIPGAFIFWIVYADYYADEPSMTSLMNWVETGVLLAWVGLLALLRFRGALRLAGLLYVCIYAGLGFLLMALDRTPISTTVMWLVVAPLMAVLFSGAMAGGVTFAVILVGLTAITYRIDEVRIPTGFDLQTWGWAYYQESLAMIFTVLLITLVYRHLIEARSRELEKALSEVKTLSGLLPICASCKKIRDSEGQWIQVEVYVRQRSEAEFTHGICPDCVEIYYPEILKS